MVIVLNCSKTDPLDRDICIEFDPRKTCPAAKAAGDFRSDRRGVIECDSKVAFPRGDVDTGDNEKNRIVSQYNP